MIWTCHESQSYAKLSLTSLDVNFWKRKPMFVDIYNALEESTFIILVMFPEITFDRKIKDQRN